MTGSCATLCYTDDRGADQCVPLAGDRSRLLIGRSASCDIVINWDLRVSREHAIIELIGSHWFVSDDGMSTHGTYVQPGRVDTTSRASVRVRGLRRLEAEDRLLLGHTLLTFRMPPGAASDLVPTKTSHRPPPELTPAQQRVLDALCAPLHGDSTAMPASNAQIMAELHIGVDAVKDHLQVLYKKFEVHDLPRGQKRIRLAQFAVQSGQAREWLARKS